MTLTATLLMAAGASLAAIPLPGPAATKIDSRLLAKTIASPDETVSAWVQFADKGEHNSADLRRRLAEAERALSPRNRARRIKAGVSPIVDMLDLPVHPEYLERLAAIGLKPYATSRWFNRAAVRVPAGDLPRIAELPFVSRLAKVERAYLVRDPAESGPEGLGRGLPSALDQAPEVAASVNYGVKYKELQQLNLPAVHDLGYRGQGVLICVLDNGFPRLDTHRAMTPINIPAGYRRDVVDGDTQLTDEGASSHGTRTLACIGANLPGHLVGAAYEATFAVARTENDTTETPVEMTNWSVGAEWADSLGADIISSSLGYFDFDPFGVPDPGDYTYADMDGHTTVVTHAAEVAASKGILVVNAAGNEGDGAWFYIIAPADADGDSVLAAGGVDSTGVIAAFSSRGPSADGRIKPDLCTRGVLNWVPPGSPATDSTYSRVNGTSFACPLLAGTCAVVMSAHPSWPATTVIRALRETASRFSTPDNVYGYGIPDALAALSWSDPLAAPPSPARSFGIWLAGPNPIHLGRSSATLQFALGPTESAASASVRVVDVSGRAIRTLWSGALGLGQVGEARWDGSDDGGRRVLPGVYWIALQAGGRRASVRVVSL